MCASQEEPAVEIKDAVSTWVIEWNSFDSIAYVNGTLTQVGLCVPHVWCSSGCERLGKRYSSRSTWMIAQASRRF